MLTMTDTQPLPISPRRPIFKSKGWYSLRDYCKAIHQPENSKARTSRGRGVRVLKGVSIRSLCGRMELVSAVSFPQL